MRIPRRHQPNQLATSSAPVGLGWRRLGSKPRVAWASVATLLLIAFLVPTTAVAQPTLNTAGVIISDGEGGLIYGYVGFAEESITGIELLKRTEVPLVTIAFGGLGEGVCTINVTGCPASECRQRVCQGSDRDDPFWKYFRQTEPGVWVEAPLGGSGTQVRNGDIDAWVWTGTDANLPAFDLTQLAGLAGYDADRATSTADAGGFAAVQYTGQRSTVQDRQSLIALAGGITILATMFMAIGFVIWCRRTRGRR